MLEHVIRLDQLEAAGIERVREAIQIDQEVRLRGWVLVDVEEAFLPELPAPEVQSARLLDDAQTAAPFKTLSA